MRKKHKNKTCQCASCKSIRGEYRNENNPFYGKKHTKASKKQISKNHADVSKKNNPNWKDERVIDKNYYCKDCDKKISVASGLYGKGRCPSCASKLRMKQRNISGVNNPFYGKVIYPKWGKYRRIWMRSSWEIKFAYFLDLSGYKWKYESKTFDLGDCTYTPDFYIPEWKLYIEVKGYFSDKAKNKIKKFKRMYPNINIKILMESNLQNFGLI